MKRGPATPTLAALALLLIANTQLHAQLAISITNPWTIGTLDGADLSPADTAGGRIPDPWPASPDDDATGVLLTITNAVGAWTVEVEQVDVTWDADVIIQVRRRTAGTGGTVSGATGYFALNGGYQEFFTGTGNPSNIRIQFRLQMNEPATRVLPVDAEYYLTHVRFKITDSAP